MALFLQIFSGVIPFPNLRNDGQVIAQVVVKKGRPEKPPDAPVARSRGLDILLWSLIEQCWNTDPFARLSTSQILNTLEDYKPMTPVEEVPHYASVSRFLLV